MKKLLALILVALIGLCSGCASSISKVPPGACAYWEHVGNYGPFFQTHVIAHSVVKNPDGSLTVGDYTGMVQVMGYGPHDVVQGLVIDAATVRAAQPAPKTDLPLPQP